MNDSKIENELEINFWRQHIMEGLLRARNMPDEIKKALNKTDSKMVLTNKYGFSPHQAQALMDLRKPVDGIDKQSILNEISALKEIESTLKNKI